ncbi:sodium-dependent transporter [Kordiimonas lacus]|uniref:Neurotransmitter:Na+ symporter, NSS family n=1 Tax=Kordiimonas lacus TaxID=637679 RepID=A0A1G7B0J1_9PROT|nr:sodium-dependent transporter [Kordiimonas lacus]SDE20367.1 neurotransmitter:Na+ symporter, NSS family [Kordiimonas lacus]
MAGAGTGENSAYPSFSSRIAFIIVTAGSAVGLGNVWGFPYVAGQNGGGGFVLIYLLALALVAAPAFMAELMLGRMGKASPPTALGRLQAKVGSKLHWPLVGWTGLVGTILVLSFYAVIAGQAMDYMLEAAGGGFAGWSDADVQALDANFKSSMPMMALWSAIFMGLTALIVSFDINTGLEQAGKVMMPLLLLILLGMVIYSGNMGDFGKAVDFLFGFHEMEFTPRLFLEAMGQAFFTLGVGVGGIMTYGSYMGRDVNLPRATFWIVAMDVFVALAAGLAIFPLVFSSGVDAAAGPGLVFLTLPLIFADIPGGAVVAFAFFLLLTFAAVTSSISLLSPTVARLEEAGWSRRRGATVMAALVVGISLLTSYSFAGGKDVFPLAALGLGGMTFFDLIREGVSNFILPLSGLAYALMVGWALSREDVRQALPMADGPLFRAWHMVIRYVAPICITALFVGAVAG